MVVIFLIIRYCSKLTGEIPKGLFDELFAPPADNMFSYTFENCRGLTRYADGNLFTIPAGDAINPYLGRFSSGGNMDKTCPVNTYNNNKTGVTFPVAVCNPCPDI